MQVKELDLDLLPQLKDVNLRAKRKILSKVLEGSWTTLLKGRGMEFAGFRKYSYGDDASMIDWGASLRSKDTLIREFEEYKNVSVFLLLDISDSMLFTSGKKTKAELGAELIFTLSAAIMDNGDSVGFAMFNDDVTAKCQPGVGKEVIYRMVSELQKPRNYGGKFSLKAALRLIEGFLKSKALIILVSDFIGMEDNWERYVKMLGQKNDLVGIAIRDPRDSKFPEGGAQMLIQDPYTNEKLYVDSKQYKKMYEEEAKKEADYLRSVFEKAHSGFISVRTDEDMFAPLLEYFRKRTSVLRG